MIGSMFNNMEVSNDFDKNRFDGMLEAKVNKMGSRGNGKETTEYME